MGFLLEVNRRFKRIEGKHLALVICLNLFVAVIPLLIIIYAFIASFSANRSFGVLLVRDLHLTGNSAVVVRDTFTNAKSGKSVALSIDYGALIGDYGARWVTQTLAFKPYPCGTMTHPYIDCARRLGARIKADDVVEMVCEVGEGTVHRLWEPLAAKQHPANGYAGKFSTPYCIAAGFVRGNVGLSDFTDAAVHDPAVLALAAKVRYRIDPQNPYPKNFTGHIRVTLRDGSVVEERQPYMRGGAQEPLTRADIEDKFRLNAKHGGWSDARAAEALKLIAGLFDGPVNLAPLRG